MYCFSQQRCFCLDCDKKRWKRIIYIVWKPKKMYTSVYCISTFNTCMIIVGKDDIIILFLLKFISRFQFTWTYFHKRAHHVKEFKNDWSSLRYCSMYSRKIHIFSKYLLDAPYLDVEFIRNVDTETNLGYRTNVLKHNPHEWLNFKSGWLTERVWKIYQG